MINIHFHKSLQKYTGLVSHKLEVATYSNLKGALIHLFPKLGSVIHLIENGNNQEKFITMSHNKKDLVPNSWMIKDTISNEITDLWILPGIAGSGDDSTTNIILGVVLIAIAIILPILAPAVGASLLGGALINAALGIGINLVLGGILELLMGRPDDTGQTVDENQRKDNDLFAGLQNTIDTGTPVQLNYGMIRVSGHFISGFIDTVEHGRDDTVNVQDTYFS